MKKTENVNVVATLNFIINLKEDPESLEALANEVYAKLKESIVGKNKETVLPFSVRAAKYLMLHAVGSEIDKVEDKYKITVETEYCYNRDVPWRVDIWQQSVNNFGMFIKETMGYDSPCKIEYTSQLEECIK